MTAPRITAEEIAEYRTEYSTAIYAGHTVSHVNRILDALESAYTERDRLHADGMPMDREELQKLLNDAHRKGNQEAHEAHRLVREMGLSAQGGEVPELTEEPVVVEDFADNGAHSQWRLVIPSTNTTLWEEATASPAPPHPDTVEVPLSALDTSDLRLHRIEMRSGNPKRGNKASYFWMKAFANHIRAQAQPTTNETRG